MSRANYNNNVGKKVLCLGSFLGVFFLGTPDVGL